MSHKKFGPDRFSRFDVYWIQTNKQTNRHPDKPNLYIDLHAYRASTVILDYLQDLKLKYAQILEFILSSLTFCDLDFYLNVLIFQITLPVLKPC